MLKDRKILMEQEAVKLKQACGQLYLKLAVSAASEAEHLAYETMRAELSNMLSDIAIVDQMIEDGNE